MNISRNWIPDLLNYRFNVIQLGFQVSKLETKTENIPEIYKYLCVCTLIINIRNVKKH